MGNLPLLCRRHRDAYRVLHIDYRKNVNIPLEWPDTFAELLTFLNRGGKATYTGIYMEDACSSTYLWVDNELSYRGIVPRHKEINGVHVYYALVTLPVLATPKQDS